MELEHIICLRQVGQSSLLIDLSKEGHGDCRYCKPDENNKYCSGYYPIKLRRFVVVDREKYINTFKHENTS